MTTKTNSNKFMLVVLVLALAACAPAAAPATQPPAATQTPAASATSPAPSSPPAPTSTPAPTATAQPTIAKPSFTPATYQDKDAGFEVDYPAGWTLVPKTVIGSRGSQAQLFSPGATAEKVAPGSSRLGLTVYQWDPKKDLPAFMTHRMSAWEGSGFTVTPDVTWELADGRGVASFIVLTPDKLQTYFLLTTVGQDYLEISGEGDLALVQEIAQTLRPAAFKP
jgi:hypothetical protein